MAEEINPQILVCDGYERIADEYLSTRGESPYAFESIRH